MAAVKRRAALGKVALKLLAKVHRGWALPKDMEKCVGSLVTWAEGNRTLRPMEFVTSGESIVDDIPEDLFL
jgi:hypothetical protein